MDGRRVAGGRRRLRGGIGASADLHLAARAFSLGLDGLPLLELAGWERATASSALEKAEEFARVRLQAAIVKALDG